jgi:GrpB-like predicted nucleotidyltransferase (UPF0157 family)
MGMQKRLTPMLGLERHTVRLLDYDPHWALAFELEAAALWQRVGDLVVDIQHVGSTAVPGIVAKPILDIVVATKSRRVIPEVAERLAAAGFVDRGDAGADGGYLLVKDSGPDVRVAHVHLVERADPQWQAYIRFRDALRTDACLRDEYAALKTRLAERHPTDRAMYTGGKQRFIRQTLDRLRHVGAMGIGDREDSR